MVLKNVLLIDIASCRVTCVGNRSEESVLKIVLLI